MVKKIIGICIPIYNEENNLSNLIDDIKLFIQNSKYKKEYEFEIIFYDDGSEDNSLQILDKEESFTVIDGQENKGLGYSIKRLFNEAISRDLDGLVKLDGDGQMKIKEIDIFLEQLIIKNSDVIYGNRFLSETKYPMPIFRKIGSRFFSMILKLYSIKIKDPTNGFIYVGKKYLQNYKIFGSYNAAQQILVDSSFRNLRISEVPVNLNVRDSGKSFIGIKYPLIVLSSLIILTLHHLTNRLLIIPGMLMVVFGFGLFIYDIYMWLSGISSVIITNDIIYLLFIGGIQLIIFGTILDYFKIKNNN